MRFKILFFIFIFIFFITGTNGKGSKVSGSFGRSSSRSYGSSRGSSRGSSHGTSHGGSHGTSHGGTPSGSSHRTSYGGSPSYQGLGSYGSSSNKPASHSTGSTSGSITHQQNKNINNQFLNAEGGGATRPAQTRPAQPPYPTHSISTVPASIPTAGGKPGVVTESKQTSPFQPSAPHENVMKSSAGTLQTQGHPTTGQTNHPWGNPYLNNNKPTVPAQSYPPWSSPNSGLNPTSVPHQTNPPWGNPYLGNTKPPVSNSQPAVPGSYPHQIGFKDHVYPQTHPTSAGSPFNPSRTGHPPYPTHPMPSSGAWSSPPTTPSLHQTNSMPLGNPYTMHSPYNSPGQPYYPQQPQMIAQPAVQPFVPGQTILMLPGQQDSGRGFGQMVKEALVFSTINAGVNRILNSHTHTHYVESRPDTAPTATTHITYNNQYFNTPPGVNGTINPANVPQGTTPDNNSQNQAYTPNVPQGTGPINNYPSGGVTSNVGGTGTSPSGSGNSYVPNIHSSGMPSSNSATNGYGTPSTASSSVSNDQQNISNNPASVDNTLSYRISDDELLKISEELFAKSPKDLHNRIKLNLQTRVTSPNITDEAKEPLFDIDPELLEYPTIYVTRSLYDSYEYDYRKKLNRTLETRKQENLLIDTFLNTHAMERAMQWLADRGFIDPDDFERKDVLRRIWFTMFSGSTCGFERVFASENYGTAIIGVQDWIYFQSQESRKRIDYMGYVDKLDIGSNASLVKLNFQMDGIVRPNATIFVGTGPELEMSLYTICSYARPNNLCPVSLAGTKFNIYTHSFTYFGNEVIDLALPMF